jgi:ABC-type phosphate transport system substrate-binding protein
MKYNGSSWVTVGSAGFSADAVDYPSLAIDGSGMLYVAYADWGNGYKATVMKYNGGSWVAVGSVGFSAGDAEYTSLAIDGSGTPYVAYVDWGYAAKATVKKYNGSSWVTAGSTGFSAGQAEWTSLAIDGSGTPYLAYKDWSTSYQKATVMKYAGGTLVGQPGANAKVSLYPNPTTKGAFVVSTPEAGSVGVYTLEGREVMRSEVKAGTTDITLPSNTTTGVYVCRFTGNEGAMATIMLTYDHE